MIILALTTDKLEVVTSAAADIDVHVSFMDVDGVSPSANVTPGKQNTAITTAATTDVLAAPGANIYRNAKTINIANKDTADSTDVTVRFNQSGTIFTLVKQTLAPNDCLEYVEGVGWFLLTPNPVSAATQAEQEAGTSLVKYVSPGRQHFHPSASKCWGKANGAGTTLLVNYNVTSIADTGTGRLGVTIATDFSGVDYAILAQIERGVTTLGVADVEQCAIRNASPTAGVFEIESYDHTATTLVADDPANYFWACFGDQA